MYRHWSFGPGKYGPTCTIITIEILRALIIKLTRPQPYSPSPSARTRARDMSWTRAKARAMVSSRTRATA